MVRKFQEADIEQLMQLWLSGNIDAHPFIPQDYWLSNYDSVRRQLFEAEIHVCEDEQGIQGFVGLTGDYIAGIFVKRESRSCGIGKQLLDCAKSSRDGLTLNVYRKNSRAAGFYTREGFVSVAETVDTATGEPELSMSWRRSR